MDIPCNDTSRVNGHNKIHTAVHGHNKTHTAVHGHNKTHTAVHGNNKIHTAVHGHNKTHTAVHGHNKTHTAVHGLNTTHTAVHGHNKTHTAVHGNNKIHTAVHGNNKTHTAFHGQNKTHTAVHGHNKTHTLQFTETTKHTAVHGNKKTHCSSRKQQNTHTADHGHNKTHTAVPQPQFFKNCSFTPGHKSCCTSPDKVPGSSVGIVTGYGHDDPGDRIPVGARFSAPVQTGPGAHPASCKMRTGSFSGVKSSRGMTLTPQFFYCRGQERVQLYLYPPYRPYGLYRSSVPVQGCTLHPCALPCSSQNTARLSLPYTLSAPRHKHKALPMTCYPHHRTFIQPEVTLALLFDLPNFTHRRKL